MTFNKLGYVKFNPKKTSNFSSEAIENIIKLLSENYYDKLSTHTDNCEEPEIWLEFSKEDISYKKLIGELITQEEYDALVENDADVILFY